MFKGKILMDTVQFKEDANTPADGLRCLAVAHIPALTVVTVRTGDSG